MKKTMGFLTFLVATILLGAPLHAQINFTITGSDATQFPDVKLTFKVTDSAGNRLDVFTPGNFTIMENGIPRPIISVTCPPPPAQSVSVTLTFDISYSMNVGNRMVIAKNAAQTLIEQFTFPPAQAGITTFHDAAAIHQPYTTDKPTMLAAINALAANGNGTNLYAGFMDPTAGAIPFTQNRTGKRAIVFLTDAYELLTTAQINQIIAAANASNIIIYTIAVINNPPPPYPFRTIATSTGGKWYEGIVTQQQAIDVYKQIAIDILNPPPCELVYRSSGCDLDRSGTATVTIPEGSSQQNFSFTIPTASLGRTVANRYFVDYGLIPPPQTSDQQVIISARNRVANIQSITTDKSQFTITSYGGAAPPFTLGVNQSRTITVRYTPTDTGRITGSLIVASDAPCNAEVILAGGKLIKPPLTLVRPNGGEQLNVASTFQVQWLGIDLAQQVTLDYSTDAGDMWNLITSAGSGLQSNWNVPNTPSNRCLMRVTSQDQRNPSLDKVLLPAHGDRVNSIAFSKDGSILASASNDRNIRIWRPENGDQIQIITGHTNAVRSICINQDAGWIASGSADRSVRIWKLDDGALLRTLPLHAFSVHTVSMSEDGTKLLTSDERDIKLWRTSDFSLEWNTSNYSDINGSAAISPNRKFIVSAKGNDAHLIDAVTGSPIRVLTGHSGKVRAVAFSPDNMMIATASDDRTVRIWRVSNGQEIRALYSHIAEVYSVAFSYDGTVVLSGGNDNAVKLWRLNTGQTIASLSGHDAGVNAVAFSPFRNIVASGSSDKTIRLWGYQAPQSDASDSLWTIISASANITSTTPSFPTLSCPNPSFTDASFEISNSGNQTLMISAALITGQHAPDFQIVTAPASSIAPLGKSIVTVRFSPKAIGIRDALLRIESNAFNAPVFEITLTGRKDSVGIFLSDNTLDFGETYECTQSLTKNITLRNTGTIPISVDEMKMDSAFAFSILSPTAPLSIDAGRDTTITIQFSPNANRTFTDALRMKGIACGLMAVTSVEGSRVTAYPQLSDTLIDFGGVTVGNSATRSYVIKNRTKTTMHLSSLALAPPSGEVTLTPPITFPLDIPAGDSLVVTVRYQPLADGSYTGIYLLESDQPCTTSQRITVRGASSTSPFITATTPIFPTLVCSGETQIDTTIMIENKGGQPLIISRADISGTHASDFILVNPTSIPPVLSLQPGEKKSITIRFKPTGIGTRQAFLTLTNNAANTPSLQLPLLAQRENVAFQISNTAIDFGDVFECTQPIVKDFDLTNTSTIPITFPKVSVQNSPSFIVLDSTSQTLNPTMTGKIRIRFNPVAPPQFGVFSGTITLKETTCGLEQTLTLTGRRVNSMANLSSSNLNFGNIGVGTTASQQFTITNPTDSQIVITALDFLPLEPALTILSPSIPFTIAAHGTQQVLLRYAPTQNGVLTSSLEIRQSLPCPNVYRVQMIGQSALASASVALPNLSGKIGDVILIPITIANAQNLTQSGVRSFRTEIQFNRTMLWLQRVLEPQNGTTRIVSTVSQGDTSVVTLEVDQPSILSSGAIGQLEFLVLLGNSDTTALRMKSFQWLNGIANTTLQDGMFTTLGVCLAGGKRLIGNLKAFSLWQNVPNPFGNASRSGSTTTEIFYSIPATSRVKLEVYSSIGKLLVTLIDEVQNAGIHRSTFDATPFMTESEVFFYRLTNGDEVLNRRMLLLK